jgi:hypothetical protein
MQNWKFERQVKNTDDWEKFIKEARFCNELWCHKRRRQEKMKSF